MIPASAYKNPHHVLLLFEKKESINNQLQAYISDHINYYENLKTKGKVVISGNFWNQASKFIIVHVSSDTELEQIINNDPAICNNILELLSATPF